MVNKFCGRNCLRLELDENGETLENQTMDFENELESEGSLEIKAAEVKDFARGLKYFEEDFKRFLRECARCSSFKSDGKATSYSRILQRAQKCKARLDGIKLDDQPKEGEIHAE